MTNRLTIKEIFHGGGKLTAKGQIVSIGLIEEGLKKKFTIRILEETPHRLRCKVYRYFRLYGGPIIFPNHSLEVSLQNEPNQVIINYRITDYDYYILMIGVLIAGISMMGFEFANGIVEAVRKSLIFSIGVLIFFGSLILIDARLFAHRIRRVLEDDWVT